MTKMIETEIAQDIIDALTMQRDAALNDALQLRIMLFKEQRMRKLLEKSLGASDERPEAAENHDADLS